MARRDTMMLAAYRYQVFRSSDGSVCRGRTVSVDPKTVEGVDKATALRTEFESLTLVEGECRAEYQIRQPGASLFQTWGRKP